MHIDRTVLIILSIAWVALNCCNAQLEGLHNLETSTIIDAKNVDKAGGVLLDNKVFALNETDDNNTETKVTVDTGIRTEKGKEEGVNGKLEHGEMELDRKIGLLRSEECGSSSDSCVMEDKALVACLRVPGNESPDLSLLIQNKGNGTATVTISAPEFVHVETNEIDVPEKESRKMKVSIRNKGTADTVMVLKSGNGNCTLDFNLIGEEETIQTHFGLFSNVLFLVVAAFLIIFALLLVIFIGLSRKRRSIIDMELLPVSNGSGTKRKTKIELKNDGWEGNWSDDWDDEEEATKTSFLNVKNPSFSQDVISSRRTYKDAWKD